MSKYIEPTQTTFNDVEQVALDMLAVKCPSLVTKAGSVVRELVVRPLAYLAAWSKDNLESMRERSSAVYLKTSTATDNPIADAVASNYFITRRSGVRSTGTVTLTVDDTFVSLPSGVRFTADGRELEIPYRILARPGMERQGLIDGVLRLNMVRYGTGTLHLVQVPVSAVDEGPVEIAAGTDVEAEFGMVTLVSAALTSAVTGGYGAETDSQLMARAEAATVNGGIGSYYGIKKKLDAGPVRVQSFSLAAGEDSALFRARYNTINVNPGGKVDCYVKTQNQLACRRVSVSPTPGTYTVNGATYSRKADIPSVDAVGSFTGATCVLMPIRDANGDALQDAVVAYGSSNQSMDEVGARLSANQTITVYYNATGTADVLADVLYMPGLLGLQQYLDADENRFVGQDVLVKSAVPVSVTLDCVLGGVTEPTDDQLDALKQAMADYINGTEVGSGILNFSDIRAHCAGALNGADLRLPCTMTASVTLMNGETDTFYSNTGTLDIRTPVNASWWNPSICYFSVIKKDIRISQA